MKPKVFGIGFHKTATTSLSNALTRLGYRVTGPNWVDDPNIADRAHPMAFKLVEQYDAFQDNPWPMLYRELDCTFAGSKFILTVRPVDKWIKSIVGHFGEKDTAMRKWIYGVGHPKENEHIYVARYESHNREVIEYFHERPQDLLVFDITAGEGWEKLCPFLGERIPPVPFPSANTAAERDKWRKREESRVRQIYNTAKAELKRVFGGSRSFGQSE